MTGLRIPARQQEPAEPVPTGQAQLRRKLKTVDDDLVYTLAHLREFSWAAHDDINGRLRALQSLETHLLDLQARLVPAVAEVEMCLELAMDDYRHMRELDAAKFDEVARARALRDAA